MPDNKLLDKYNRTLNYLRISITDRCNLNCSYCSPHTHMPLPHKDILTYEEILRIVKIVVRLGISKIRVTGGEPLVRKGVYDFLDRLSRLSGISDLSLTTNGVFLKENIHKIKSVGIKRINFSLDTLDRKKFMKITGQDSFLQVWEGIQKAHELGFSPIKINVVALNGINDDELVDLAKLSFSHPFHIRFIEYMPIGDPSMDNDRPLLTPEIIKHISILGEMIPIKKELNDGPAQRYKFKSAKGEVGFISPLSHHFCDACNRLRLTANGRLRACLLSEVEEDLKGPIRSGYTDKELSEIILKAAKKKPMDHGLPTVKPGRIPSRMSTIGG